MPIGPVISQAHSSASLSSGERRYQKSASTDPATCCLPAVRVALLVDMDGLLGHTVPRSREEANPE